MIYRTAENDEQLDSATERSWISLSITHKRPLLMRILSNQSLRKASKIISVFHLDMGAMFFFYFFLFLIKIIKKKKNPINLKGIMAKRNYT